MKKIFGIDIGGTTIKIGYFNDDKLIDKWEIETDKTEGGSNILHDISNTCIEYMNQHDIDIDTIDGYGIGVPGPVSKNVVNKCVNLGWGVIDVEKEFKKYIGQATIKVNNDANVAAAGEHWQSKENHNTSVFLTLGTGVGGGIIINNNVYEGTSGAAAEFGHMIMDPNSSRVCGCGNKGCLETIASATGIVNEAKDILSTTSLDTNLVDGDELTAKDIFDSAKDGDMVAYEIVEKITNTLAIAISHINLAINPEVVIIGGGVSKAGDILLNNIKKHYVGYAMEPIRDVKFEIASLENDAGIYGAAYMIYTL